MIDRTLAVPAFDHFGLGALGATSGRIATTWAGDTPSFDAATGALTRASGPWRAPMAGTLQWHAAGAPMLTDLGLAGYGQVAGITLRGADRAEVAVPVPRRQDVSVKMPGPVLINASPVPLMTPPSTSSANELSI